MSKCSNIGCLKEFGIGKVFIMGYWRLTCDGDVDARRLADRHYSRKTIGANLFCGPGEKMVLITVDKKAVFVWRKCKYRLDKQVGVECTLFRNESNILSSELIKEACIWALSRWPGERLFTYVKNKAIRSTNPGYCFQKAGWQKCGTNKYRQLTVLENCNYQKGIEDIWLEKYWFV